MSIIKCKECGSEISDKAVSCPKCGAPNQKEEVRKETVRAYEPRVTNFQQTQEKGSSTFKILGWSALIVVVVIAIVAIYNNPNTILGVNIKINTPKPVIATQRADNANSSLFNFKETVYATVTNQGGDGNVLVNFHITQDGKTFTRTKSIYIRAGQNLDISQVFDEVRRMGGEMKYSVDVNAQ